MKNKINIWFTTSIRISKTKISELNKLLSDFSVISDTYKEIKTEIFSLSKENNILFKKI